ncbi:hypothetical protein ACJ73_01920 [Blastomyces percursus]|uniref:Uncharacterized protein n=1 Tax=Blastomyces percursus TaxID=1658174 RepID=A0A1J9QDT6_9EURO|nr:hypothetical protein ACJ73_01920 [Blastomyces percursus]
MVQERWRHGGEVGQIPHEHTNFQGRISPLNHRSADRENGETWTSHHTVASPLSLLVDLSPQEAEAEAPFPVDIHLCRLGILLLVKREHSVTENSPALEQFGSCPRHASATPRGLNRRGDFFLSGHVTLATNQTFQTLRSGQGLTRNGPQRSKADTVSAMQRHYFHWCTISMSGGRPSPACTTAPSGLAAPGLHSSGRLRRLNPTLASVALRPGARLAEAPLGDPTLIRGPALLQCAANQGLARVA